MNDPTPIEGVPANSDEELKEILAQESLNVPPKKPDVTPTMYVVVIGAITQFSRAFGIWDASPEQVDALNVACGMLVTIGLGDVLLRGFRNLSQR
jgi:hypothetical protein